MPYAGGINVADISPKRFITKCIESEGLHALIQHILGILRDLVGAVIGTLLCEGAMFEKQDRHRDRENYRARK